MIPTKQTKQQNLSEFVQSLDDAGFLIRICEEKSVDELAQLAEDHPNKALLVEKVKDCDFSF